jgi:hypothetical protein
LKRPIGVTIIAVLTFFGAAILALGSCVFFFVAVMGMTDGDSGEPVSVAIAGMAAAGGSSLLVLAAVATCLAIGVLELRESARIASVTSFVAGIVCVILSLFAFRGHVLLPVVPSVVCHLLVITTAVWMVVYLLRTRVKEAIGAVTVSPAR